MPKTSASARVIESIRADIASGRLKAGARLPTRRELCEQYGIAAMTAARVVRTLVQDGLVVSDIGRGVFVADPPAPGAHSEAPTQVEPRLVVLEERVRQVEERLRRLESTS